MIFLTGVPGWLGSRIVDVLREGLGEDERFRPRPGLRIRALVQPGAAPIDDLEVVTGDLRDPDSLRRFMKGAAGGTLIHAAGVIHPPRLRDFHEVNVVGTANLLEAARKEGLKRLVFVSSSSAFGVNAASEDVFTEESTPRPSLAYGHSKYVAEGLVRESGLEAVIVRAPWFYGPRQPARQTRFFELVRAGLFPLVSDGEMRRSMAHVDNLCEGILLAASVPVAAGRDYWISDRRPYPLREIVETVRRVLEEEVGGVKAQRVRLPRVFSRLAESVDAGLQRVGLYEQQVHVLGELGHTIACDVKRARSELGYRARIELEEGMRGSVRWLLEQGWRPR